MFWFNSENTVIKKALPSNNRRPERPRPGRRVMGSWVHKPPASVATRSEYKALLTILFWSILNCVTLKPSNSHFTTFWSYAPLLQTKVPATAAARPPPPPPSPKNPVSTPARNASRENHCVTQPRLLSQAGSVKNSPFSTGQTQLENHDHIFTWVGLIMGQSHLVCKIL